MSFHTAYFSHRDCSLHEMGAWHPECPARLQAIEDRLIAARIWDLLEHQETPLATREQIARVHSEAQIRNIETNSPTEGSERDHFPIDPDTSINQYSWRAALRAAGAVVAATEGVNERRFANAFCAIRPPGHHATPNESMGFCLFNNVAIGVQHAFQKYGLERIAVIDFDVHHGNGTELALQNDERARMYSFFQHPLYPFSGTENPAQNMFNTPVPAYSRGDVIRELVLQHWIPSLLEFKPQMIFISAGFDAHREDELGQMGLVEDDYAWITRQLMNVAQETAQGRIVSSLEGGYNLSALARSVTAHVKVLAGLD